ncbi:MAG: zinc ribbon domain-containing protein, partial [Prochlorothrix sp.]|nr:zinc ribbon domain-containing protein [Prochlorothrix sp.]
VQAKKRIQSHRCIQCNAQLHSDDPFCPHCGFNQFQDCPHCHSQTYQYSPFCRVCGTELPLPKIQ